MVARACNKLIESTPPDTPTSNVGGSKANVLSHGCGVIPLFTVGQLPERRNYLRLGVTRDHVLTAIREGIPFEIKMADGERYEVDDRDRIAVGKTSVVVFDNRDLPHILPLLTMTGLSYLKPFGSDSQ
jgi:hypothetical protein